MERYARRSLSGRGRVVTHHSLGVNASGTDVSIFGGAKVDWMFVDAPAYHAVHLFEISGSGKFALKQRYGGTDLPQGTIETAGFSVSSFGHVALTGRVRRYTTSRARGDDLRSISDRHKA